MKILSSLLLLAAVAPLGAQTSTEKPAGNLAPMPVAAKMATATPFITGLKEPQGMALDGNNLLVCDYGAGEILRFSRDGKPLGKFATGLKGPSAIVMRPRAVPTKGTQHIFEGTFYVTERKANRVIRIDKNGEITPIGSEIAEPIGLIAHGAGLSVVSHTTSKIYEWRLRLVTGGGWAREIDGPEGWTRLYSAPAETPGKDRYGFRWLAEDWGILFMSDEVGERILMVTRSGRVATFASGISDPSGIVIGPDKMVYVANEGDGGQLLRLNAEGEKTVVAEKLGRPRGILFLDAKTVLVSNRDGGVWKVVLP